MEDKIEIIDEGENIRIKGQFSFKANEDIQENKVITTATRDIKKGENYYIEL